MYVRLIATLLSFQILPPESLRARASFNRETYFRTHVTGTTSSAVIGATQEFQLAYQPAYGIVPALRIAVADW
jgi:hypothetical protein